MEQILAHLVGDYLLQTSHMARHKIQSWTIALLHAAFYTLPFVLITRSSTALSVILGTHALIDRYRLARVVSMARNMAGDPLHWRHYRTTTGFTDYTPVWMATWLEIVIDNTMHLLINYFAILHL
jgi:hypothetical protein